LLYDKIHREDIFRHAYALAKANAGAPGVDQENFSGIDSPWLKSAPLLKSFDAENVSS
jgi:RNA-directed DNA polymerase